MLKHILQAEQELMQLSKQLGLPEQGQHQAGKGREHFKALFLLCFFS